MIASISLDEWCRLIFAAAVGSAVSTIIRMIIDAKRMKRHSKITQIRRKPVFLDSKRYALPMTVRPRSPQIEFHHR